MSPTLQYTCLALFMLLMAAPGLYGMHLYLLIALAERRWAATRARRDGLRAGYRPEGPWPRVTTQLPLYNELAVAARVIEAVAAMDYPRDRHQIQVLDDSSDETRAIVDSVAARLRAAGHDITVVRRGDRRHYKAGALAHGLARATGEYVAIFDADFVPPRDFLRRLVPLIAAQSDVACVQGRWGHLNQDASWMTEALALGMDGHFGVEQPARSANGLLLNFNGTAGVWRRAAIEDPRVGGWSGDTITEDLDLSYRAQLAGWRIEYAPEVCVPAEVPADVDALKAQQRRWATGSMQCARKLLPVVLRSPQPLSSKLEACVHLTQYAVNPLMVAMVVFGRPLLLLASEDVARAWLEVSWFIILAAAAGPSIAYLYGRWRLTGRRVGMARILGLIVLGFGLSLNNTVAVARGLWQRGGEFVRTPKSGGLGGLARVGGLGRASGRRPAYRAPASNLWWGELLLGAFCFAQWLVFLEMDRYVGGTFLLLFAIGLGWLGWESRPEWVRAGRAPARVAAPAGRPVAVDSSL